MVKKDSVDEIKVKKQVNFFNVPTELPLGMYDSVTKRWYRGFEVEKMSSDVLVSVNDEQNPYRLFGKIVAKGLVNIFDIDTGEEYPGWRSKTSKLFFQDVFFLMVEILIKTRGTSLVSTVYRCPLCKKFTKFENAPGEGAELDVNTGFDLTASSEEFSSLEMEDIRSVAFKPVRDLDKPEFSFHFDDGVVIKDERFTEFSFRIPEIGDYILKAGADTSQAGEKRVLFHCLTSVNGLIGKDLELLKAQHGLGLLSFNFNDYAQILSRFNSIGYDFSNHTVKCAHCGNVFKTVFDFTNFFGSLLGR